MRKTFPKGWAWLLLGGLFVCGCDHQDRDRLTRMARAAGAKVQSLGGASQGELGNWGAFRMDPDQAPLGVRVASRIRWDKLMENAAIEVVAKDGEVELKGVVRDAGQRDRAIELAADTVGTEKVNEKLSLMPPGP